MITLKTLPQATAQEVYDQIAKHLITQGTVCFNEYEACVYHGPNGMMCAAGCLIAKDEYLPEMDSSGFTWFDMVDRGVVPAHHNRLISRFQSLHDCVNGDDDIMRAWQSGVVTIAQEFDLIPYVHQPE